MNSFKSVLPVLTKYLKADIKEPKAYYFIEKRLEIKYYTEEDFPYQVYESLFKWITEPIQSPDHIIELLDVYVRKLDGFDKSRNITPLIAFTCLEALAVIRPEVLTGPWEKLAYMIVNYSDTEYPYNMIGIRRIVKIIKPSTLKWIVEVCSPKLCPNPCLRLELCRLVKYLGFTYNRGQFDQSVLSESIINRDHFDQSVLRQSIITATCEISSKYSSLEVDKLPRCDSMELEIIMKDNLITFEDILRIDNPESRIIEIFAAMIKLAGLFALLEKKRHLMFKHDRGQTLRNHMLIACISFFGLDPYDVKEGVHSPLLTNFIAIKGNSNLLDYATDTLQTIQQASVGCKLHGGLCKYITHKITRMTDDNHGKPSSKRFKAMLS